MTEQERVEGIAIIGMAGRFPGAPDVATFWKDLCDGVESLGPFSEEDLRAAGVDTSDPAFINSGGAIDGTEEFDASFFGMSKREAELTDPQHRVLLETVWATLEDAGYDPGDRSRRIGIFGGVSENLYLRNYLLGHPDILDRAGQVPVLLASAREYAITRVAYKFGLTGPAVSVGTACSTSGVAIHLAVQSLLSGDSDLALAGCAYITHPIRGGYLYVEDGILSADGHVRAFDADARGTVMASGVAFVALKPLASALEDGDTIYAVIRGSAINNDGSAKVGFTAPSLEGQRAVIEDALAVAGVDADTIGMVEAHGTGTSLGDPIEIAALTQAYRRHTQRRQYCAIGSLKSNIGHLEAAAGVTGVIKAALSLYHERIPPSINYRSPNPQIDFASSPFFVNTELRAWERTDQPRRAAVSSFGFGGTNVHIVLEEAPLPAPLPAPPPSPSILTLSAKTAEALESRTEQLAAHLMAHPEITLADAAHTLAVGRSRMPHRRAIVAHDTATAVERLRQRDPKVTAERVDASTSTGVAFLFTGQGAQFAGMGAGLYRSEPVFAEAIEECARLIGTIDGYGLIDLLYGDGRDPAEGTSLLLRTGIGQPAIFSLQYALARLLASWGIEPAAMIGHSVGEIAAACLGGVFTLPDAVRLAVARGRLMQDLPTGAMTAVLAEPSMVLPLLDDGTSLAAVNAPEQSVASGPPASIEALEQRLAAAGIAFRRLPTDRAFHSPMMEPAIAPLRDEVDRLARGTLGIPMVSTATGTWITASEIADPDYWGQHARTTVLFADAVGRLLEARPDLILLEVGPGETLASLARQHPALSEDSAVISMLPHRAAGGDDATHVRLALAHAWAAGADLDWVALHGGPRRRIPLPTYPFARERHWIDRVDTPPAVASGPVHTASARIEEPVQVADAARVEAAPRTGERRSRIVGEILAILEDLSGLDPASIDVTATFTELGFDSLFLTQANSQFRKRFGVRVTLGQLLGETSTVAALAERIDAEMEPETIVASTRPTPAPATIEAPRTAVPLEPLASPRPTNGTANMADKIGWLITEQLRIMEEQLELLRAEITRGEHASDATVASEDLAASGIARP